MEQIKNNRKNKKKGYPAFEGGCSEVYLEKCFNYDKNKRLENAKLLGETSLMFLVHPTISEEEMKAYSEIIRVILKEVTSSKN